MRKHGIMARVIMCIMLVMMLLPAHSLGDDMLFIPDGNGGVLLVSGGDTGSTASSTEGNPPSTDSQSPGATGGAGAAGAGNTPADTSASGTRTINGVEVTDGTAVTAPAVTKVKSAPLPAEETDEEEGGVVVAAFAGTTSTGTGTSNIQESKADIFRLKGPITLKANEGGIFTAYANLTNNTLNGYVVFMVDGLAYDDQYVSNNQTSLTVSFDTLGKHYVTATYQYVGSEAYKYNFATQVLEIEVVAGNGSSGNDGCACDKNCGCNDERCCDGCKCIPDECTCGKNSNNGNCNCGGSNGNCTCKANECNCGSGSSGNCNCGGGNNNNCNCGGGSNCNCGGSNGNCTCKAGECNCGGQKPTPPCTCKPGECGNNCSCGGHGSCTNDCNCKKPTPPCTCKPGECGNNCSCGGHGSCTNDCNCKKPTPPCTCKPGECGNNCSCGGHGSCTNDCNCKKPVVKGPCDCKDEETCKNNDDCVCGDHTTCGKDCGCKKPVVKGPCDCKDEETCKNNDDCVCGDHTACGKDCGCKKPVVKGPCDCKDEDTCKNNDDCVCGDHTACGKDCGCKKPVVKGPCDCKDEDTCKNNDACPCDGHDNCTSECTCKKNTDENNYNNSISLRIERPRITYGWEATLTATLKNPVPDGGTISFYDGATHYRNATVKNNAASVTTMPTPGRYTFVAQYSNKATYCNWADLVVDKAKPDITLKGSRVPATSANATLTAVVSPPSGSKGVMPTGTVVFLYGNDVITSGLVDKSGSITVTWKNAPVNNVKVTARYLGDTKYEDNSTTENLNLLIAGQPTTSPTTTPTGNPPIIIVNPTPSPTRKPGGSGGGSYTGDSSNTGKKSSSSYVTLLDYDTPLSGQVVRLLDEDGTELELYDSRLEDGSDGIVPVDTSKQYQERTHYTYEFNMAEMRLYSETYDEGYYEIEAGEIAFNMPFEFYGGFPGLREYLTKKNLSTDALRLRATFEQVDEQPTVEALDNPNFVLGSPVWRVSFTLHDPLGNALDFEPEAELTVAMELRLATTEENAMGVSFNPATRALKFPEIEQGKGEAVIYANYSADYGLGTEEQQQGIG